MIDKTAPPLLEPALQAEPAARHHDPVRRAGGRFDHVDDGASDRLPRGVQNPPPQGSIRQALSRSLSNTEEEKEEDREYAGLPSPFTALPKHARRTPEVPLGDGRLPERCGSFDMNRLNSNSLPEKAERPVRFCWRPAVYR